MKKIFLLLLCQFVALSSFSQIDKNATPQTKALYRNLKALSGKGFLFGHHFTNMYGQNFSAEEKDAQGVPHSDVKTSVGDFPAVFSFDFNKGYSKILPFVIQAARQGAIITISYHMENPYGDGNGAYLVDDSRKDVSKILPGAPRHAFLLEKLDSIAAFADRARLDGVKIPIIFRPWHEHTGNWFWWGSSNCTPEEFVALWRFTVEYLRDKKGVDNFLYSFSPSHPAKFGSYEHRNPGPEYFDIAGFDCYRNEDYSSAMLPHAQLVVRYALEHDKIPAITEFGFLKGLQNSKDTQWLCQQLLKTIKDDPLARKLVFGVTWRNGSPSWWVPLPGDVHHDDFVHFYRDPFTFFLSDWKKYSGQ